MPDNPRDYCPGSYVAAELEARDIDLATFAKLMGWTADQCASFISGDLRLRVSEAEQLSRLFAGTHVQTWLNLEREYRRRLNA